MVFIAGVDESYALNIPGSNGSVATITSGTIWGALHGLETFSQLVSFKYVMMFYLCACMTIFIYCLYDNLTIFFHSFDLDRYEIVSCPWIIKDWPRFSHRGILIDTARHFEPIDTLKLLIDSMTYGIYYI